MLRERLIPTQSMISNLIAIELAHINTSHPDFIGGSRAVSQLMERMHQEKAKAADGRHGSGSTTNLNTNSSSSTASTTNTSTDRSSSSIFNFGRSTTTTQPPTSSSSAGENSAVTLPSMPSSVRQNSKMTDRELIEVEIIKSLIRSYFNIVRKNIGDLVPKTVMYFLVNHAKENVQSVLVQRLYRDSSLEELLRETNDAAQRRKNCAEVQALLRRALEIVNEVRDFSVFTPSSGGGGASTKF